MRIWDVAPRIAGYRRHPETKRRVGMLPALAARQRRVVEKMRRGYRHASPTRARRGSRLQRARLLSLDAQAARFEVIRVALRVVGLRRPLLPAAARILRLAAWPPRLLPRPPLTPDALDFVNQPATVDTAPLLARIPRRLTPLAEGLGTYLAPRSDALPVSTAGVGSAREVNIR